MTPPVRSSTTDRAFDELVPPDLRHLSQAHWTPVDVAIDWSDFEVVYLYNPFELPLFPDALTPHEHALAYAAQVARSGWRPRAAARA